MSIFTLRTTKSDNCRWRFPSSSLIYLIREEEIPPVIKRLNKVKKHSMIKPIKSKMNEINNRINYVIIDLFTVSDNCFEFC